LPGLVSREALFLFGGIVVLLVAAFVLGRVLRSLRHGFSIRLQLFFAIALPSLMVTGVIGLWVIDRLEARAAELALDQRSVTVVVQLLTELGPKITFLVALLGVAAAGAAFALGRGVAVPLERLTRSAEAIARGERHGALPDPVGREVRLLTAAFESMRRALEERHEMERFVADLSHELKNPVSAIRAATEVLLEGAAEEPESRDRFLSRIEEASLRLQRLLQDLLALARLEARGVEPSREIVSLDELIRQGIEGQSPNLEAKAIRVETELQPIRLMGDAHWIRRALDNLLSNAIRYSPREATITLELQIDGEFAALRIHDRGPGIADGRRIEVFERFVTDRQEANQTGLGLAIVRSVAELHGGGARILDTTGEGASIEMWMLTGSGVSRGTRGPIDSTKVHKDRGHSPDR